MGECAKQLTDAVAVPRASGMPRRAVGCGYTQRLAGIRQPGELGVLAQASEDAATRVGDDELEGALTRSIGDETTFWPPAVFEDIVYEFAERAHQPGGQSPRQSCPDGSVFGMFGPLVPDRPLRTVFVMIVARKGKDARSVAGASAADDTLPQRSDELMKHRRFDCHSMVVISSGRRRDRELGERSYTPRAAKPHRPKRRQSAMDRLPEQVISRLEACGDLSWRNLAQVSPRGAGYPTHHCRLPFLAQQSLKSQLRLAASTGSTSRTSAARTV
jgi:hypothetical protein